MDIVTTVRSQLQVTHERVKRCLGDLSEEEARRSPLPRLSPVVWQVGHLAFVDALFAQKAGAAYTIPKDYERLFKMGTGGQAEYPPVAHVGKTFDETHAMLLKVADSTDLAAPVESHAYTNIAGMLIFACYHRGYHVGKMTSLRALLEKPILFG
jgi:hypothetical protein